MYSWMRIFPTLPGLAYSVIKRPIFNTGIFTAQDGTDIRLGYWNYPVWEFDLSFNYLPDYMGAGATSSDLKALMGFYTACQGQLLPFLFKDPDDNTVTNQYIGNVTAVPASGTMSQTFVMQRAYGLQQFGQDISPVGFVDDTQPFSVSINGTPIPASGYTLNNMYYNSNTIAFNSTIPNGGEVTANFSYYYACRFADDKYDFSKDSNQLWSLKKITLRTIRMENIGYPVPPSTGTGG